MTVMQYLIIIIIQITVTTILGFWLKNYLPSYFSQKGKNLANKEDIEELTDKVQKVTSLYAQKNNEIEQKLSYLLSIHSSHRSEERVAIIEFYESYMHWMYTILEIPIDQYNSITIEKIINKKFELDDYFISVNKSSAKLLLLVKNEPLLNIQNEMIVELIRFKGWTEAKLFNIQTRLEELNRINAKFSRLLGDLNKNRVEVEIIAKEETEILKKLEDDRHAYKFSKVSEFMKCKALAEEFAKQAKTYLTSIE